MKTLVVYDSVYGNTKTIAQTIGAALPGEVTLQHVDDVKAASLAAYDLIIVGAPTHGAKPSPAVQRFLDQISEQALEGKNVAGFDTPDHALWHGRPKNHKSAGAKGRERSGSPRRLLRHRRRGSAARG
jgi:flavodoxin